MNKQKTTQPLLRIIPLQTHINSNVSNMSRIKIYQS